MQGFSNPEAVIPFVTNVERQYPMLLLTGRVKAPNYTVGDALYSPGRDVAHMLPAWIGLSLPGEEEYSRNVSAGEDPDRWKALIEVLDRLLTAAMSQEEMDQDTWQKSGFENLPEDLQLDFLCRLFKVIYAAYFTGVKFVSVNPTATPRHIQFWIDGMRRLLQPSDSKETHGIDT